MTHRAPSTGFEITPRVRQTAYYAGSLLLAVLGVVQLWTGVSAETVTTITDYINGILILLGATAPAYAGLKVESQIKQGVI